MSAEKRLVASSRSHGFSSKSKLFDNPTYMFATLDVRSNSRVCLESDLIPETLPPGPRHSVEQIKRWIRCVFRLVQPLVREDCRNLPGNLRRHHWRHAYLFRGYRAIRAIPETTALEPCDHVQAGSLLGQLATTPGMAYMRYELKTLGNENCPANGQASEKALSQRQGFFSI